MHKRVRSWAAAVAVTVAAVCLSAGSTSSASTSSTTPPAITITTSAGQSLQLLPGVALAFTTPQLWQVGQPAALQLAVRNDSNASYYNGSLRAVLPTALSQVTVATSASLDDGAAATDIGAPDASYPRGDGTTVLVWRNVHDLAAHNARYFTLTGTMGGEVALGSQSISAEVFVNDDANFVPSFYENDASSGQGSYRAGDAVAGAQSATGYATVTDLVQIAPADSAVGGIAYGSVWVDATKDSQRSPSDPGLPGAQLRVCVGASWCVNVTADAQGRWHVLNPPDGTLSATLVAPTIVTGVSGSVVATGTVSGGRLAAAADLGVNFVGSKQLSGSVWRDYARNGAIDPMDTAAAGIVVQATWLGADGKAATGTAGSDDITFTATTDNNGRFQLPAVPTGKYLVALSQLPAGWTATAGKVGDGVQQVNVAGETTVSMGLVMPVTPSTQTTRHLFGQQVIIAAEPTGSAATQRTAAADPLQPTAASSVQTVTARDPFGGTATAATSTSTAGSSSAGSSSGSTATSSKAAEAKEPLAYTGIIAIGALALALPLLGLGSGLVAVRRRFRPRNSYTYHVEMPEGWNPNPPQPRWLERHDGDITSRVGVDWLAESDDGAADAIERNNNVSTTDSDKVSHQDVVAGELDSDPFRNPTPVRAMAMAHHREVRQKLIWAAIVAAIITGVMVVVDTIVRHKRQPE